MTADVIQARYDNLDAVASRFGGAGAASIELQRRVARCVEALEHGGWIGRGADAFFAEMHGEIYPAMQRLTRALEEARSVTLEANRILRAAEEEAAGVFSSGQGLIPLGDPPPLPLLAISNHLPRHSPVIGNSRRSLLGQRLLLLLEPRSSGPFQCRFLGDGGVFLSAIQTRAAACGSISVAQGRIQSSLSIHMLAWDVLPMVFPSRIYVLITASSMSDPVRHFCRMERLYLFHRTRLSSVGISKVDRDSVVTIHSGELSRDMSPRITNYLHLAPFREATF